MFTFPGLIDIRAQLPRANWSIGTRKLTTHITIHYNGPAVAATHQSGAGLIAQLKIDTEWQMRPGALGAESGGDGLQYHFIVAADGQVYQTRDIGAKLWHCGDPVGNAQSIAVHLPLGDGQNATDHQWAVVEQLCEALRDFYGISSRTHVLGHKEWPQAETACPGLYLIARLQAYRAGSDTKGEAGHYVVITGIDFANIRQGRSTSFPVAGKLDPGTAIDVDDVTAGWAHLSSGLGFVSMDLLRAA